MVAGCSEEKKYIPGNLLHSEFLEEKELLFPIQIGLARSLRATNRQGKDWFIY